MAMADIDLSIGTKYQSTITCCLPAGVPPFLIEVCTSVAPRSQNAASFEELSDFLLSGQRGIWRLVQFVPVITPRRRLALFWCRIATANLRRIPPMDGFATVEPVIQRTRV